MKSLFTCIVLICSTPSFSQIKVGDIDMDGNVNVTDVVKLVHNILEGKDIIYDPFKVDNTRIIGKWWTTPTSYYEFKQDGSCFFNSFDRYYEFRPNIGRLIIYNDAEHKKVFATCALTILTDNTVLIDNTLCENQKPTQLVTSITLSRTSLTLRKGTFETITATVSPNNADNQEITWSSSDESIAKVTDGIIIAIGIGNVVITATAKDGSNTYCSCNVKVVSATQNTSYIIKGVEYPMPEAIDLGLPSGTKWANMNIGANTIDEVGGFYGWADPTGELTFYDYPYMGRDNWQNVASFYPDYYWGIWTSPLFGGTNPPKDIQGSDLDIARNKLGSNWVVPSADDFKELSDNCTFTKEDGYYLVTGKNGNSIKMVNSGFYSFDVNKYGSSQPKGYTLNEMTSVPCFWASTRSSDWDGYEEYYSQYNYPAADYAHCYTDGFQGADGTCDSWYRVGMIPIRAVFK